MKSTSLMCAMLCVACAAQFPCAAGAADLEVLCTIGVRTPMQEIAPRFEQASGHHLRFVYDSADPALKRIRAEEHADVAVLREETMAGLVERGTVDAANVVELGRAPVAMAVRKGTPKPDISTPAALKRAMLDAKSIVYADPVRGGGSAVAMERIVRELGIAEAIRSKTMYPQTRGMDWNFVLDGRAELGFHQLSEIPRNPQLVIVGPLPKELQRPLVFQAAPVTGSKNAAAAKEFVIFATGPIGTEIMKSKGMDVRR
jgi:molybdate transport system substrate-binding protein